MSIPITGAPRLPSLSRPDDFNSDAQNIIAYIVGSMLDQFNAVDPADFFSVQSSAQDTTVDRVLKVGAFGLGANVNEVSNLDTLAYTTLFRVPASSTGAPTTDAGFGIHLNRSATIAKQIVIGVGSRMYIRDKNTTWGAWRRIVDMPASMAAGDLAFFDGADFARLAKGTVNQVLEQGATNPFWGSVKAPKPGTGISTWTALGAVDQLFLPPGGQWSYALLNFNNSTGASVGSQLGGVAAGGSRVAGPAGSNVVYRGFGWRVE